MSQDVSLTSLAGLWLQERQLFHIKKALEAINRIENAHKS